VYILGLLALVLFLVLYLDGSISIFVLSVQGRWGLLVATWVSSAGDGLVNAAVAAIIMATGLLLGRPREVVAGRLGLFAVAAGGLSVQIPKHLFCRSRPMAEGAGTFFVDSPCLDKGYRLKSFPSGHSVTAFALAYVLSRAYPRGAPVFYALATVVALSRVYLASHFLSDIVAGAAYGLFAGWIVCRLAAFPLEDARS
jgi:membrane-associated phospholipid phosphatase